MSEIKEKFYQRTWFTVLMLFLFFPVGLIFMWKNKKFGPKWRIAITAFFVIITIAKIGEVDSNSKAKEEPVVKVEEEIEEVEEIEEEEIEEEIEVEEVEAEPEPEPEPEPVVQDGDPSYSDKVQDLSSELSTYLMDFTSLFSEAGNNPAMLYDESWIMDLALTLSAMDIVLDDMSELDPPDIYKESYSHLEEAIRHYQTVVSQMPKAIDNEDVNLMIKLTEVMSDGNDSVQKATDAIPY